MAQEQFGVMFVDGSKKKLRRAVEELKNESAYLEVQQELDEQKMALDACQYAVCAQEAALDTQTGLKEGFSKQRLCCMKKNLIWTGVRMIL